MRDGLSWSIQNEENTIIEQWTGKEWLTYGDSIIAIGNGTQTAPFTITNNASWQRMASAKLGFSKHYGRGVGGQTFIWNTGTWYANANGEYVNRPPAEQPAGTTIHKGAFCSWDRITTMIPQNFEGVIFVMGGTNDFGVDIGENPVFSAGNIQDTDWVNSAEYLGGDFDTTKFKGAIASTIMKVGVWCPKAIIIMGTPLSGRGNSANEYNPAFADNGLSTFDYANALIEVARFMSVPYIDVFADTGINQINRKLYISDAVHPYLSAGKEALARAVISGVKRVYPRFL